MLESWINRLIEEEGSPSPHPQEIDRETVIKDGLLELKSLFQKWTAVFNQAKKSQTGAMYMYKLARSETGFLIFRKGCRLIFSPAPPDQIHIQLLKKQEEELKTCVNTHIRFFLHNPFSPVCWTHEGWPGFVDMNILARYYMKLLIYEENNSARKRADTIKPPFTGRL